MNLSRKSLVICMTGTVLIALAIVSVAGAEPARKPFRFVWNAWLPPGSGALEVGLWYNREVKKIAQGKIAIKEHVGGALGGGKATLDLVRRGTLETGFISPGFVFSSLPLAATAALPYMVPCPDTATRALRELYETFPPLREEFEVKNNVKPVGFFATDIGLMGFSRPVRRLEDIQGKKIRAYAHYNDVVRKLGAVPVSTATGEIYEAVKRGVVVGFSHQPFHSTEAWKLYEVAPYLVDYGSGVHAMLFTIMNLDVWKALPPEIKEIFEEAAKRAPEAVAGIHTKINKVAANKMRQAGVDFYRLPPDEMEKWKKLVVPELWDEWIARMEKPGVPVGEFVKRYRALVQKYQPQSTYVFTGF